MDTFDKWLTIDDLANYIKMSRTKLYGMAQRGSDREIVHDDYYQLLLEEAKR